LPQWLINYLTYINPDKKPDAMKKAETPGRLKEGSKKIKPQKAEELKTEGPLSEKDEVKQAEEKMRKRATK